MERWIKTRSINYIYLTIFYWEFSLCDSTIRPVPPTLSLCYSLIRQQVFHQFVLVPEAAERVHALQHVWVDVFSRGQHTDRHFPWNGLLRLRLVLPPTANTRTEMGIALISQDTGSCVILMHIYPSQYIVVPFLFLI